eukprot:362721-Chlamydomonas_euryale.AAC.9
MALSRLGRAWIFAFDKRGGNRTPSPRGQLCQGSVRGSMCYSTCRLPCGLCQLSVSDEIIPLKSHRKGYKEQTGGGETGKGDGKRGDQDEEGERQQKAGKGDGEGRQR